MIGEIETIIIKKIIKNFRLLEHFVKKIIERPIQNTIDELESDYDYFKLITFELKNNDENIRDYQIISTLILNNIYRIYDILKERYERIEIGPLIEKICKKYEKLFLADDNKDGFESKGSTNTKSLFAQINENIFKFKNLNEKFNQVHKYSANNKNLSNFKINNIGLNLDNIFIKK